jgi:hypothetical protein
MQWVSAALKEMEKEYGEDTVAATVRRYSDADREVYQRTLAEHDEIVKGLMTFKAK